MSRRWMASDGFLTADELKGRRVLVLGLGMSGQAVARALLRSGADVRASDARADLEGDPGIAELRELGAQVEIGGHRKAGRWLADSDLMVPSPGISPTAGLLQRAIDEGVPVVSEIELASRYARAPIVAVTGTNGKTTTCGMVGAIFEAAEREAVVCGNIGRPFITSALEHARAEVFVVEVSSFQLNFCYSFHPSVAIVTNIAPDHLDWHGSMEGYMQAKARVAARQTPTDWFVYPGAQPDIADLAPSPGPRRVAFAQEAVRTGSAVWAQEGRMFARLGSDDIYEIGPLGPLAELGRPFVDDALASAAAGLALGVPPQVVDEALIGFRPDGHRIQVVATRSGVRFVDDSKATNPHATVAAIRTFDHVVLIAGGRNKGLDLSELARETSRLRGVVSLGEAAPDVERAFIQTEVEVRRAGSIGEAVAQAWDMSGPGDVVLLSPSCSSFDAFANYAERGEAFQEAVGRLLSSMPSDGEEE